MREYMAKAYDRVEWVYLREIMLKLSFEEDWVQTIMKCVETVSSSVQINVQISEFFKPTRGIHQGDTISPFFLLCAEGLFSFLKYKGPSYLAKVIRV